VAARPAALGTVAGVELTLDIRSERFDSPVAAELIEEMAADMTERYGSGDATPIDPAHFEAPDGAFFVAYLDGEPVGSAGWRTFAGDPDAAEMKRVFVRPQARNRGVATALLRALEESARAAGRTRMILETGSAQPEAIALYLKVGYVRIADFGHYKDEPDVRSYGRDL
jgi:GNAT superfamily N-acetyltransferase